MHGVIGHWGWGISSCSRKLESDEKKKGKKNSKSLLHTSSLRISRQIAPEEETYGIRFLMKNVDRSHERGTRNKIQKKKKNIFSDRMENSRQNDQKNKIFKFKSK